MTEYRINIVVDPSGAVRGTRRVNRELDRTAQAANRTRQLIARAFTFAGVVFGIRQLVSLTDTYIALQNRLRTVTQGRASFHMQFEHYQAVPYAIAEEIAAKRSERP